MVVDVLCLLVMVLTLSLLIVPTLQSTVSMFGAFVLTTAIMLTLMLLMILVLLTFVTKSILLPVHLGIHVH